MRRMNETVELELDLSGLTCPMPLLKTKQALNKMTAGALVRVIATDPASERDFKVFSEQSGNALVSAEKQAERFVYILRKA